MEAIGFKPSDSDSMSEVSRPWQSSDRSKKDRNELRRFLERRFVISLSKEDRSLRTGWEREFQLKKILCSPFPRTSYDFSQLNVFAHAGFCTWDTPAFYSFD